MARMSPVLSRFAASDGLLLHRCDWPCVGETKGTLLVVHGLGEHIGRYDRVAMRLNAAGWHVAGYDQRGHGQSEGARGAVGRRDSLLFDLGRVVAEASTALPASAPFPREAGLGVVGLPGGIGGPARRRDDERAAIGTGREPAFRLAEASLGFGTLDDVQGCSG